MKLHQRHNVDPYKEELDSVKFRESQLGEDKVDKDLVVRCQNLYANLDYFRRARAKVLRFAYGDHYDSKILIKGKWMHQRDYLAATGGMAIQINQVKKVINTIAGLWTTEKNAPTVTSLDTDMKDYGTGMTEVVRANWRKNAVNVLSGEWLNEADIGGLAVAKEEFSDYLGGKKDAVSKVVNPNMFFFDSGMQDSRFGDLTLIGQLHDMAFNDFCSTFAQKPSDFAKFREWYASDSNPNLQPDAVDISNLHKEDDMVFDRPCQRGYCRVIEVWTRERRPRYHVLDTNSPDPPYDINADDTQMIEQINRTNKERQDEARSLGWKEEDVPLIEYKPYWFIDTYWYCRFLTPDGHVIWEGESTLPNRSHPYTVMAVPFTNGRIVGHASDAVDLNIAMERALVVDDMVKRAGAKGVMMVPEDIVPDWMDWDEFAEQATSINGIVYFKPKPHGQKPEMIYSHSSSVDATNMVGLLSRLLDEGVNMTGAIQGQAPTAGTSAALYAQQKQNAAVPLAPLLERFRVFMDDVAMKKLQFIQENYTIRDYAEIVSSDELLQAMNLNLAAIGDLRYKVAMGPGVDTPQYRDELREDLMMLVQSGSLTTLDYVQMMNRPYMSEIEKRIQRHMEEMAVAQAVGKEDKNPS
jgi:hypothetical protein